MICQGPPWAWHGLHHPLSPQRDCRPWLDMTERTAEASPVSQQLEVDVVAAPFTSRSYALPKPVVVHASIRACLNSETGSGRG